jgi:hypothetical protein
MAESQTPVVSGVGAAELAFQSTVSDRFVYARQFVPLDLNKADDTPLLSIPQAQRLSAFAELIGLPELNQALRRLERNDVQKYLLEALTDRAPGLRSTIRIANTDLVREVGPQLVDEAALRRGDARLVERGGVTPLSVSSSLDPAQFGESFSHLIKSEMGYLFLDRTRIRPSGFEPGEWIFGLSLFAGEEVTLEQKTFSKREITFEQQNEEEKQFDLELSSTLSTELQEGAQRQNNLTTASALQVGAGFSEAPSIPVRANTSYTDSVNQAHTDSEQESVKTSEASTSKVASKYRSVHRTTFRVASEERFESTAKRVIRNPSRFVPMGVHYFKLMKKLTLRQERYGVRLCWSPSLRDPGLAFTMKLEQGRLKILADAEKVQLPDKPPKPRELVANGRNSSSATLNANRWDHLWCNQSYDYDIEVPIPAGFVWDGDKEYIRDHLVVEAHVDRDRTVGVELRGEPQVSGDHVSAKVHVWVTDAFGGKCGKVYITAAIWCIPDPSAQSADYKARLDAWSVELAAWETKCDTILKPRREQAEKDVTAWIAAMWKNFSPMEEMIGLVVSQLFPAGIRNEFWEIEHWRQVFDWENAAYYLYPGWWSNQPTRDPTLPPTHFINASWARLYLPIRIGFERPALRWIHGKVVTGPLDVASERAFDRVEGELSDFREHNFGSSTETSILDAVVDGGCPVFEERFICMGTWEEQLPTDGTHIEVVQSKTTALDSVLAGELADAHELRQAQRQELKARSSLEQALVQHPPDTVELHFSNKATGQSPA